MASVPHRLMYLNMAALAGVWGGGYGALGTMTYAVEMSHHGWPLKVLSASGPIPNGMPVRIGRIFCALGAMISFHVMEVSLLLYLWRFFIFFLPFAPCPTNTGYYRRIFQ